MLAHIQYLIVSDALLMKGINQLYITMTIHFGFLTNGS